VIPVFLLGGTLRAQEKESKGMSSDQLREVESQYLKTIRPHKIDEKSEGIISAGAVILYGQWVEPPFQFAIRDDALLLNGVAIDPPIIPPWKAQPKDIAVSEADREISDLTLRIRARHRHLKGQGDGVNVEGELLQHIAENEPTVDTAEWSGTDTLHIVMTTGEEFSMRFSHAARRGDPAQVRDTILQKANQRYAAALESGALLVIGYGPVLTVPSPDGAKTHRQIQEALEDESNERLRELVLHDELVRELLFVQQRISKKEG